MMDSRESGAIAPQFLVIIILLSVLGIAMDLYITHLLGMTHKALEQNTVRKQMDQILSDIVASIKSDPSPETDSIDDPVWLMAGQTDTGFTITLKSLSSSLNPNYIRKNVFDKTSLSQLLSPGKTSDELQQFREDTGLSLVYAPYSEFFTQEVFKQYFAGYGWANINLVDEFSVRTLSYSITNSESIAENARQTVRTLLSSGQFIDRAGLRNALGMDYYTLFPYINAEPLMNVNFVDPFILKEIISYPEYNIENPLAKATTLLNMRETGGVTQSDITNILGIDKNCFLYYYFGAITWFWEITIEKAPYTCMAIICRYPPDSLETSHTPPVFQCIEMRYEP